MTAPAVTAVIFDMDGVLCDYDRDVRIARMAEITGLEPAAIVAAIWDSGFDERADEGEFSADEYLAETQRLLGWPITAEAWAAARRAGMTPKPDMLVLARELRGRVTTACLTNNGPLMHRHMNAIFPEVPALFGERMFFSSELGVGKPAPAVFLKVLERIGGTPAQALFIDDDAGYIAGAIEAGLRTHLYSETAALEAELRRLGVL